ncbi:MAG: hypothetical protein ACLGIT_17780 [Gammaproteobacteria bacterium]
MALAPRSIECWRSLAHCHCVMGRWEEAEALISRAGATGLADALPRPVARRDDRPRGRTQGGLRRAQQDRNDVDRGGAALAGPAPRPAGAWRDDPRRLG